jgi:hypothetical protein
MELQKLSTTHQVMFSDLISKSLDADFQERLPLGGSFQKKTVKDRDYWYYVSPMTNGRRTKTYIGPVSDEEISSRVKKFNELKSDYGQRRDIVRSLIAAGLPSPSRTAGDLIEALAQAGIFRLRSVLVGSAAFQTYSGYLGVKIKEALLTTIDVDFAQFHAISVAIDDKMAPILETLKNVDETFRAIQHLNDADTTKYRNAEGIDVEFLTPNTGSDKHQGKATAMPVLGGASAEPLRFLDFLIHKPIRSVLLHRAGIAVTVPAPDRYAVHKLIVSVSRQNDHAGAEKSFKDTQQASALILALDMGRRSDELGEAWMEAWKRGPNWRDRLEKGVSRLDQDTKIILKKAIDKACALERVNAEDYYGPNTFLAV